MFVKGLSGCAPAEGLSWPGVQLGSDGCEVVVVPAGEVGAFREYWRRSPLVFSFVPRCQGLCGSVKNTGMPVSTVHEAWAESSLPRSQVSDRVSCAGSVDIAPCSS